MDSIQKHAERILNIAQASADDKDTTIYTINRDIYYLLDDTFKLLKNINETSLPGLDRNNRLKELETKFGIPIKNLL